MREEYLKRLFDEKGFAEGKIEEFLRLKALFSITPIASEIAGHMEKAEHNLRFVSDALKMRYTDWAITGCYYAVYQAALALSLKKGFFSKNHEATLCVMIKHYYNKKLSREDIELFNEAYLDNQDIMFYVESKNEREKASYSTVIHFNSEDVNSLRVKAMLFVRKCASVLR